MSLKHHVILITGAGGGLGSTAALTLAKNGAHIILLDKNIAKLEAVYDAILAANGPEPMIFLNIGEPDFTAPPLVQEAAARAVRAGATQYTQPELFAGFHLMNGRYQPIEPDSQGRLVSRQLDLLLVPWKGSHPLAQEPRCWLRWAVLEGSLLPTEEEQAVQAIQLAEQERQKAQHERERALALAAKLRALGVDPEI